MGYSGYKGTEVHGELRSTDLSMAEEIKLYRAGSLDEVAVGAKEFLDIHSVQVVTAAAAGTEVHVFIGADSTPGDGETVVRGTFAQYGGVFNELRPHYSGVQGGKPYAVAGAAGVTNIILKGCIRKA